MPNLIEDALTAKLTTWLGDNRPADIPPTVPIQIANRDELRTRPCIVGCVKRRGKIALVPLNASPRTEELILRQL